MHLSARNASASLRKRRLGILTATIAVATLVTGCSALGSSPSSQAAASTGGTLSLTVGANPSVPSAALYVAAENGFFAKQGLNVKIVDTKGGSTAIPNLVAGAYDITTSNYATIFTAQAKHAADLRILIDGISATPNTFTLHALPTSGVTGIASLAGKTIGVSSQQDIITDSLKASMLAFNVPDSSVKFVQVPFSQGETELRNHQVDATVLTPPYDVEADRDLGSRTVVDVFAQGSPEAGLPVSGYVATSKFVKANPKAVAAFQRAMIAAARAIGGNPLIARTALQKKLKLNAEVGQLIALPSFPTDLDPNRLGRVTTLMKAYASLPQTFSLDSMLQPVPAP